MLRAPRSETLNTAGVGRVNLTNKPLVEAIFQLRWTLPDGPPPETVDPHYKLLIGRLYDRLVEDYPFHEPLPAAQVPESIAGYLVQHRFRKGAGEWPLVQLGPGITTLNDTEGYEWEDFERRVAALVNGLFDVYPEAEEVLQVNRLLLRYIDAIPFNFAEDDIFAFLGDKLKTRISLYERLFEDRRVEQLPDSLDIRFSFSCSAPKGVLNLRFTRGEAKGSECVVWETMVESGAEDAPGGTAGITEWLQLAHSLTHDWFFKLIEGELLEVFL